ALAGLPPSDPVTIACDANSQCDDGNACDGVETCAQGSCVAGAAPAVDDGDVCTADPCDPATGGQHPRIPATTCCGAGAQSCMAALTGDWNCANPQAQPNYTVVWSVRDDGTFAATDSIGQTASGCMDCNGQIDDTGTGPLGVFAAFAHLD